MDDNLTFESDRIRREWENPLLSPALKTIVRDASDVARSLGWPFMHITCIWRTQGEDKALEGTGIHYYWRAVDVRTRDQDPEIVAKVVDFMNGRYVYDPGRPTKVVAYAKPHGTGPHIHMQAHDRTGPRETPREA